ncbi:hypothetical protein [Lacticaseibacillus brantae]|uniref:Uncharacterized protein n=1 Tax=Lacticaseibacillus brantae DSM 23927 TaxID=1423727 RepID=A0A0R2B1R4_9LACO|nr:hypothetical protein [Lacticaseibacillus brantae]KRM73002.1 hypothetical protein FC34_GL000721 [Lacticaseibacillus brantae DSM 23927]
MNYLTQHLTTIIGQQAEMIAQLQEQAVKATDQIVALKEKLKEGEVHGESGTGSGPSGE